MRDLSRSVNLGHYSDVVNSVSYQESYMNVTAQKQNCQQLSKKIRFKTKIRKLRNFISDEVRTREF